MITHGRESSANQTADGSAGVYGLRIHGAVDSALLVPLQPHSGWPALTVSTLLREEEEGDERIGDERAELALLDGERAVIQRSDRTATFVVRSDPDDGRIIHPFLTAVGTIFAWWNRRHTFHGGAFLTNRGAWGVVGDRGAGKSSMLAALALAGYPVLADDLLVISGRMVLAGPRCVDLRPGVGEALGVKDSLQSVRGGERYRLAFERTKPEAQLRGLVVLTWSDGMRVRELRAGERLERLAQYSCAPPRDPAGLIEIAELPAWELGRPRSLGSLQPAVDRLLAIAAH